VFRVSLKKKMKLRSERGSVLTEFAIVIFVNLLIISLTIEYGLRLLDYIKLTHVASRAVRAVAYTADIFVTQGDCVPGGFETVESLEGRWLKKTLSGYIPIDEDTNNESKYKINSCIEKLNEGEETQIKLLRLTIEPTGSPCKICIAGLTGALSPIKVTASFPIPYKCFENYRDAC